MSTWETIIEPTPREGGAPGLRRITVPGGWLYQVESHELLHGSRVVTRCWQPPVFVAEPAHFACTPDESPPPSDNPEDLTYEEREALRWLAFALNKHGHEPYVYESEDTDRALAALDKLLGKETP